MDVNRNSGDGRRRTDRTPAGRGDAPAERRASSAPPEPGGAAPGLLDGLPRQRAVPAAVGRCSATSPATACIRTAEAAPAAASGPGARGPVGPVAESASSPAASPRRPGTRPARRPAGPVARAARSVGRLLPTPLGTPFTFGYATVLAVTSYVAGHADPALVRALHQASSTDVAHLVRYPVAVLFASALWIVGGILSPYAAGFLLVLTALERRIGGARAAGVFLLGHVVATLATEVPVGLAVWAGHLPGSSLHRFDYGISFGVAASVGSLAGLLSPWLRWPLLALVGSVLAEDLVLLDDPMTNWGHLLALALGVATWPLVRRAARARGGSRSGRDLADPSTATVRGAGADGPAAS